MVIFTVTNGDYCSAVARSQRRVSAHTSCAQYQCRWTRQKIMFALTSIKGIGRRYANLVCKKADVDMNKRFDLIRFSAICKIHTGCFFFLLIRALFLIFQMLV